MFILKKGQQPGVYVPLRALFLVLYVLICGALLSCSNSNELLLSGQKFNLIIVKQTFIICYNIVFI